MSILRSFSKRLLMLGMMGVLILPTHSSQAGIAQIIRNIPNNKYIQMGIQGIGLAYYYYVNNEYGQLLKKEDDSYGGDKSLSTIYRHIRLIHKFGGLICVRELYNTYYRPSANQSENTANTTTPNKTAEQAFMPNAASNNLTPVNNSDISQSQSPAPISDNSVSVPVPDGTPKTQTTNDTTVTERSRWQRLTTMANNACQRVQDRFSGEKSAKVAGGLRFARKWGWIGTRAGFVIQWPFAECGKEDCSVGLANCCTHCWTSRVMFGMAIQSLYNQYYGDTNNGSTIAKETNLVTTSSTIPSTIPATAPEPKQSAANLTQNAKSPANNSDTAAQSPDTTVSG